MSRQLKVAFSENSQQVTLNSQQPKSPNADLNNSKAKSRPPFNIEKIVPSRKHTLCWAELTDHRQLPEGSVAASSTIF